MSDQNIHDESQEPVVAEHKRSLRKVAKVLYDKAKKATLAVANKVAGFLDGFSPEEDAELTLSRKIARALAATLHGVATAATIVVAVATQVVIVAAYALAVIAGTIVMTIIGVAMGTYKVAQGIALVLSSPYHLAQSTEAFRTNWSLYFASWKPRYYSCFRLQTVAYRQVQDAKVTQETIELVETVVQVEGEEHLAKVIPHKKPERKGHATPRQKKTRVARPPRDFGPEPQAA